MRFDITVDAKRAWDLEARSTDKGDMPLVAVREALQNSIDAIRPALRRGEVEVGRFERGLDPARIVARGLARRLELSFAGRAVVRVQRARPQTCLTGPERRQNLRGVFQGRPPRVAGRVVLLVDDVRTTGSTLDEAARALKRAGARAVIAAVAARFLAGPALQVAGARVAAPSGRARRRSP